MANATSCELIRAITRRSALPPLPAGLELRGWLHVIGPFLEPFLLVDELVDVVFGVLELGGPEQRVERAGLHADPAVHAQGVVDGEPVEDLHAPRPAPGRGLVRLLVG